MLVGVRVTVPATVGVMAKVCGVEELEKVKTTGESPVLPEPLGVRVTVPVYGPLGVTVKLDEALPALPLLGPLKVKEVAVGVTELEALDALLVPATLVAVTVKL